MTLTAYRTPPQQEKKAAKEARASGHKAYVPTELKTYKTATGKPIRRRVPVAPGYVFAHGKPYEAKHIRGPVGPCTPLEVRRLYRLGTSQPETGYVVGESIEIAKGHDVTIPATIMEVLGSDWYEVGVTMMGKLCRVRMRLPTR